MPLKKLQITLLLSSSALYADQFLFTLYNDFFFGTDEHFTNGLALYWIDDNQNNKSYTHFITNLADTLYIPLNPKQRYNAGVSLAQIIITPKDTTLSTPQYDDLPYAGYLVLSTYLLQYDDNSFIEYALDFGVVGPQALAAETQSNFHTLINNPIPQGWDTQLPTQYTLNALVQYGEKSWVYHESKGIQADWFNHAGLTLGNFSTSLFMGSIFRFGHNYVENFNTHLPYLKEESSLLSRKTEHKSFGYSLSAGLGAEYVLYSYILDEAINQGYQLEIKPFHLTGYSALDLYYASHKFSFFYQALSPYIRKSGEIDIFGGFIYTYQF